MVQPHPYGERYKRQRRALLAYGPRCQLRLACDGAPATSADHDPPLSQHQHVPGSGCCGLVPACMACQRVQGGLIRSGHWKRRTLPEPSRVW